MPDPEWEFLGSVGSDEYTTFEWNDETYYGGWGDVAFQMYGIPSINNDDDRDDNYYACTVSMAHQDPAWDGCNGKSSDFPSDENDYWFGPRNEYATVGIDWNMFDAYSSSDLQDYKPSSEKSGDYEYSARLTISSPSAGSIGISYDPKNIEREAPERTNDEVVWEWDFPVNSWEKENDAAYVDTNLTAGSMCKLNEPIDNPDDKDLAKAWYEPKFEAGCFYHDKVKVSSAYLSEYIEKRDVT